MTCGARTGYVSERMIGMISRINLLKRKEGLSAEEFSAYLTQAHAGLLATMPYLKGCETCLLYTSDAADE